MLAPPLVQASTIKPHMKSSIFRLPFLFGSRVVGIPFALGFLPSLAVAVDRTQPPVNLAGAPVLDAGGKHINYSRASLSSASKDATRTSEKTQTAPGGTSSRFVAVSPTPKPFWQVAAFGSDIGGSNILIHPVSGGGAPEIIIGGNSANNFGGDDFWQVIRYNVVTGNYDQLFVSPVYGSDDPYSYTPGIQRIELGNVVGDSNQEIVVMIGSGDIYLYDATTKNALGEIQTGITNLEGLSLADLDGDGRAELIVTTADNLYVFSGAGNLLWQVAGVGGYDLVAGQMDLDSAIEIATADGKVVDTATHAIQWTYNNGFGSHLRLAPIPGKTYQQLIAAQASQYLYACDIANKLPRWSITTPQDIGAIQVADVDNDGVPEVIIGDGQWGTVHVHDLVTQAEKWHANNPEHGVTNIAVADVDADGVADLLWGAGATSTGSDYLYVAKTMGDHSITWQSEDLDGPFLGPGIGDLDGDGKPELVVCPFHSEAGYDSGRILVFDLATLKRRGISAPVVNNRAWTGVHDLKLRDVDGDGRMEIVIGADDLYDGVVEIYSFDSANTFKRTWTNATQPSGSPFEFVEVADLDGNGKQKIIAANYVEHTGSPGVYVYVYDYPSGTNSWTSLAMAGGFSGVNGLVVKALDSTGNKKIAALVANGDLYTFDGPTRELESLVQSTPFTSLNSESNSYRLIGGDNTGVGHFLQYAKPDYNESLTRQLASGQLNGVNAMPDGELWTGSGSVVNLRMPSTYGTVTWQSPTLGPEVGRFVATQIRDGQKCVFTSDKHAVMGLAYGPPPPTGHLRNISTRLQVLAGDNVMIGGFTVGGSLNKKVLLRTLGPTLTQFGLTGALGNPTLELYDGTGTLITSNDNWKDSQQTAIRATGLAPPNDLEPAILSTLAPGNYTAIVRGKNNTTGTGLVEVYDADQGTAASLMNISTRGFVASGQNVMIGGFISGGNGFVKLIVRALGPTLSQFNVPNVLADPVLELRDANGALLASNDNWADTQQAEIQASGYAPPGNNESAIIVTRPAASTTAIVRGKGNTTGNALVEVYALAQ